ncbi:MAG: hypothetical protein L6R42_010249 [Xanthoria sp. 1 TBL-2021]|nr:MAG: hypothetical protein L6R42_010249 [Xanthoria sp. 1 TBL-2021]
MEADRSPSSATSDHIYRDKNSNNNNNGNSVAAAERPASATQQTRANSSTSLADSRETGYQRMARSYAISPSEEKENGVLDAAEGDKVPRNRSPVKGAATTVAPTGKREVSGEGESWKRAAEVTSQLKARIELMKAKQGLTKR